MNRPKKIYLNKEDITFGCLINELKHQVAQSIELNDYDDFKKKAISLGYKVVEKEVLKYLETCFEISPVGLPITHKNVPYMVQEYNKESGLYKIANYTPNMEVREHYVLKNEMKLYPSVYIDFILKHNYYYPN